MAGALGLLLHTVGQTVAQEAKHVLADEAKTKGEKALVAVAVGWMAMVCFVIFLGTLAVAAYFYLSLSWPPHQAMAVVSLGAICLSALCGLTVYLLLKGEPKVDNSAEAKKVEAELTSLLTELEGETTEAVKRNATNATLISLVAGIVMGMNPGLRKSIF
jgi:hypothetical protein